MSLSITFPDEQYTLVVDVLPEERDDRSRQGSLTHPTQWDRVHRGCVGAICSTDCFVIGDTMTLTTNQHDILQHALGLHERNGVTWRNHYVCGGDAFINDLVAKGLMQKGPAPHYLHKEDIVYCVTDEGRKVALEEHKRRYPLFKYEENKR